MNYKVKEALMQPEISEKNCPIFNVIETTTNQIIKTFMTEKDAKQFLRHLNFGGGFDGWTPSFILKKINIPSKKLDNYV